MAEPKTSYIYCPRSPSYSPASPSNSQTPPSLNSPLPYRRPGSSETFWRKSGLSYSAYECPYDLTLTEDSENRETQETCQLATDGNGETCHFATDDHVEIQGTCQLPTDEEVYNIIIQQDVQKLQELIDNGLNVNHKLKLRQTIIIIDTVPGNRVPLTNCTLLIAAISTQKEEIVACLIKNNCDIQVRAKLTD
ncbi:unnamed protein product [Owenia fusiformis]|uniref:Uncharacterized protein n=1 Tax=Owenia fusiformis TaxID=6347 RepID=A0A8J1TBI7_OWEFU|nr:unnamed protein product [Owenia fusiformis]